jgi:hypothetical protein
MTQAQILKQVADFDYLKTEVRLLRSFIIGFAGRDPEGEYRPEFVQKIMAAAKEKPIYKFLNAKAFLGQIKPRSSV